MKLDPKVKNIAITTVACIVFVLLAAVVSLAIVFRGKIKELINRKKVKPESQPNLENIESITEDADSSEPFDLLAQGSISDCDLLGQDVDSRSTYNETINEIQKSLFERVTPNDEQEPGVIFIVETEIQHHASPSQRTISSEGKIEEVESKPLNPPRPIAKKVEPKKAFKLDAETPIKVEFINRIDNDFMNKMFNIAKYSDNTKNFTSDSKPLDEVHEEAFLSDASFESARTPEIDNIPDEFKEHPMTTSCDENSIF